MSRVGRIARIGTGIAVLTGAIAGFGILPGSATTFGTGHGAALFGQSQSLAVEHLATALFQCNSSSGAWSVRADGIQVIASDHVTTWDTSASPAPNQYYIEVDVNHAEFFKEPLTQQWSGLFGATASGTLSNPAADCAHGAAIEVRGGAFLDGLNSLDLVGTQF
jgi:hypothetical protein